MSEEYRPSKPSNPRDDWKLWLVVNPGTWLMPILMAVLIVALAVHAFVYSNDNYNPLTYDETTEGLMEKGIEAAKDVADDAVDAAEDVADDIAD